MLTRTSITLVALAGLAGIAAGGWLVSSKPAPQYTSDYVFLSNAQGNLEIYHARLGEESQTPSRLTHNELDDVDPDWSPDGRALTVTSSHDGNPEIYVIDVPDGTRHRLTHTPEPDYGARWSPDGRRIAFISEAGGSSNLYVMDANGEDVVQLTDYKAPVREPDWSADGKQIVFVLGNNLAVINADGTGLRKLTNEREVEDRQPQWSPDGTRVAFTRLVENAFNVYVVNVDTGAWQALTEGWWYDTDPRWSPDGERILWLSARDNQNRKELYVMRADGTDVRRLTHDLYEVMQPSWSPDGQRIAFARYVNGRFTAQMIPATGGAVVSLSPFSKGMDLAPKFRPG